MEEEHPITIGTNWKDPATCPHCEADLKGEPIPSGDRKYFGGATHFLRTISIYDRDLDRHSEWECPDCHKRFD